MTLKSYFLNDKHMYILDTPTQKNYSFMEPTKGSTIYNFMNIKKERYIS